MGDTDIKTLVVRLRESAGTLAQYHLEEDILEAADTLEALQTELANMTFAGEHYAKRAEKAEADLLGNREALKVCRSLLREERGKALEEAAQVAEPWGWCGYGKEICGPKIAAAIRALAGVAGDKPLYTGRIQQGREAQFQNSLLKTKKVPGG